MATPAPTTLYPGDDLIPTAVMVYDQRRLIRASPADVWPWVVQLGKARGGWYLPRFWESLLPSSWRAARHINPEWQRLSAGDRVLDYGFGGDEDVFDVALVEEARALVYRSERYGTVFTWALLLEPAGAAGETVLHLRFRGRIERTGWQRKVLVWGGEWMDRLSTAPMLAGLAERAEKGV
jgi:hypothetical protein